MRFSPLHRPLEGYEYALGRAKGTDIPPHREAARG